MPINNFKLPKHLHLSSIFFTSDLHFFHYNMLNYYPFRGKTLDEMHEQIISNWNAKVKHNSVVFVLGDVLCGDTTKRIDILDELSGIKYLIPGNHDYDALKKEHFIKKWDHIFPELVHIQIKNYFMVLCHYPLNSWMFQNRNSIHCHGHCHGQLPYKPLEDTSSFNSFINRVDVGIDALPSLSPISLVDILSLLENRRTPETISYQRGGESGQELLS